VLYDSYELGRNWFASVSAAARAGAQWWSHPVNPLAYTGLGETTAAALDVFSHAAAPRGKPPFGLPTTMIDGQVVPIREVVVDSRPFGRLLRFERAGGPADDPKLLIVAPMSGHFATLLRGTVERMLPSHDVYITDWEDAKLVPQSAGAFDLDDYIDYLIAWLERITPQGGPRAHMLAVCQPSVPALAAAALMAEDQNPARPCSVTMMGGPVDTRQAPTVVNRLASERPMAWFRQNVIARVPFSYPGAGRLVYPGFMQLAGFMAMNLGNHLVSHWEMFKHLVEGDEESAEATKHFYDEYRAVCDMSAEFYLQTLVRVFKEQQLARGTFHHRDRLVNPAAIRDIGLFAIEGERDDISGLGQTRAALDLAPELPETAKRYFMVPRVGHYGIFNGRRWREVVAPEVEAFIRACDCAHTPLHGAGLHKADTDIEPPKDSLEFA
jgi:poly(3-hydroxybutyrate) depolymerase